VKIQRNFPFIDFGITKIHDQLGLISQQLDRIASELETLRAEGRRKLDILSAQDSIALHETAEYVRTHMSEVDSVTSNFELLSLALDHANLHDDRLVCEFGVWSGATINHLASRVPGKVYGFDSFEGLPERWRDGFPRSTFKISELPRVRPNVELVRGWFENTLPAFIAAHSQDVAFLHIDCDLYSSTKTVLEMFSPQIRPGCVIVFDEYFNYPGWQAGEYKAFQEYVQTRGITYRYLGFNRNHEQVAVMIER
jgi:predicted O-methyltransferase YrrM